MGEFFKGLFAYITNNNLEWWQGLIIMVVVMITYFIGKFWKNVFSWIGSKFIIEKNETLQYRMFWGLINDAVNIRMKDEIRRSFKENGFHELGGNEFSSYVKNQSKNLVSIIKNHIINLYPIGQSLSVSMESILDEIDKKDSVFEDIFFEIYTEAKTFKCQDDWSLDEIDKKFEEEILNFIKSRKPDDCVSCFSILFGKREIAENKKSKYKTLKSQMNFAERKLTEIQSILITFYSDKINLKNKRGI